MDVTSISTVVAAGGVLVGLFLAYLEIRSLHRTRKTELFHGIFSILTQKEFLESWEKFRESESLSFKDYKKKYGLVEWNMMSGLFNEISFLLKEKLIDIDAVYKIFGRSTRIAWEKMVPFFEDLRREDPQEVWAFEYLYNEMQKREQTLQAQQQ